MGLDMYLSGEKFHVTDWESPENNAMEDGFEISDTVLRLGYWRKHPNLHGYIVQTFADGKDECQNIDLSKDGIKRILTAITDRKLPATDGFFFGESDGSAEEISRDTKIFQDALTWLETKEHNRWKSVSYRASW